jgi:hypothetical protein
MLSLWRHTFLACIPYPIETIDVITSITRLIFVAETLKAKIMPQCLWWEFCVLSRLLFRVVPTNFVANEYKIVMKNRVCGSWRGKPALNRTISTLLLFVINIIIILNLLSLVNRRCSAGKSRSQQDIKAIYLSTVRTLCSVLISTIFCSSMADRWPGSNWRFWSNPLLTVLNATITVYYRI